MTKCEDASCSVRPVSDHFDGKRYYNPTLPYGFKHSLFDGFRILLEKRGDKPFPDYVRVRPRLYEKLDPEDIAITFVNHETFIFQVGGVTLLTDPIWSKRVSPFRWLGPLRVRSPGVALEELPQIDFVLISHNHYDHLDLETLKRLNEKFSPKAFVPAGDRELVRSSGIEVIEELDWWDSVTVNEKVKITFAPTQHLSGRGLRDWHKSLWGSYMIQCGDRLVYFCGDAAYSRHFREIKSRLGCPDIALLSIGGYEPRWFMKPMHMDPAEAVQAHKDLGAKHSIGMHFGTFQLSTEAVDQPKEELRDALKKEGISEHDFVFLKEGETRIFKVETNKEAL